MWTDFFDTIAVFNLQKREDRRLHITKELNDHNIPFRLITSLEYNDGRFGLYQTIKHFFSNCLDAGMKRVLVFEDDAEFLVDPRVFMPKVIEQLPENWMQVYLGMSTRKTGGITGRYSENLLNVNAAFSTHAVAYSDAAMRKFLSTPMQLPIDHLMVEKIQNWNQSYCTFPMIATQIAGYSDIEKKETDWSRIIQLRFNQKTSNIKTKPI